MAVKLEMPLFGQWASGTISKVGTFRWINGETFLSAKQFGLIGNDNAGQAMKACFATAKAEHSLIAPSWGWVNGVWSFRIIPTWPQYWNQYLQSNPACFS